MHKQVKTTYRYNVLSKTWVPDMKTIFKYYEIKKEEKDGTSKPTDSYKI